jgi:hypothetical protein
MKKLKIIVFVFFVIYFLSCKKDKKELNNEKDSLKMYQGIIIGDYTRSDVIYSFDKKDTIDFENNGMNDLIIGYFKYYSYDKEDECLKVLTDNISFMYYNNFNFLKPGDTIKGNDRCCADEYGAWNSDMYHLLYLPHYRGDSIYWPERTNTDTIYVGLRYKCRHGFYYGWLKIAGLPYKIYEYVLEK